MSTSTFLGIMFSQCQCLCIYAFTKVPSSYLHGTKTIMCNVSVLQMTLIVNLNFAEKKKKKKKILFEKMYSRTI